MNRARIALLVAAVTIAGALWLLTREPASDHGEPAAGRRRSAATPPRTAKARAAKSSGRAARSIVSRLTARLGPAASKSLSPAQVCSKLHSAIEVSRPGPTDDVTFERYAAAPPARGTYYWLSLGNIGFAVPRASYIVKVAVGRRNGEDWPSVFLRSTDHRSSVYIAPGLGDLPLGDLRGFPKQAKALDGLRAGLSVKRVDYRCRPRELALGFRQATGLLLKKVLLGVPDGARARAFDNVAIDGAVVVAWRKGSSTTVTHRWTTDGESWLVRYHSSEAEHGRQLLALPQLLGRKQPPGAHVAPAELLDAAKIVAGDLNALARWLKNHRDDNSYFANRLRAFARSRSAADSSSSSADGS